MSIFSDRELGMDRSISRRDFLNDVGIAVAASALAPASLDASGRYAARRHARRGYYPPALTGLRGSHAGSFETAHALARNGRSWDVAAAADTGEIYDLVVVGAGLSGLAAAYFFRQAAGPAREGAGPRQPRRLRRPRQAQRVQSRPADDRLRRHPVHRHAVGVHARRQDSCCSDVGVDLQRFYTAFDQKLYQSMGLTRGVFFDTRNLRGGPDGRRRGPTPWPEFLAKTPLSEPVRTRHPAPLRRRDRLPARACRPRRSSSGCGRSAIATTCSRSPRSIPGSSRSSRPRTHGYFARGIDAISALTAYNNGLPGYRGLGFTAAVVAPRRRALHLPFPGRQRRRRPAHRPRADSVGVPGTTMDDEVTARARLRAARRRRAADAHASQQHRGPRRPRRRPGQRRRGRRRLRARRQGRAGARAAPASWPATTRSFRISVRRCRPAQKAALAMAVKAPLVYTNVLMRNWPAFQKLGVSSLHAPGGFHSASRSTSRSASATTSARGRPTSR